MQIPPLLIEFGASLVAIFALYLLARALKLGGKPKLSDESKIKEVAGEVKYGFEARRFAISRGGSAALAADDSGRIMVIKRHGNRFAGRVLDGQAIAREQVDALLVDCRDHRFGPVSLSIDQPAVWADAINRL